MKEIDIVTAIYIHMLAQTNGTFKAHIAEQTDPKLLARFLRPIHEQFRNDLEGNGTKGN